MKIRPHPRINGILIGDEVYSHPQKIFARVADVFPAAVCVKVGVLSIEEPMEMTLAPQLWRADDIENLSVCRYCGSREDIHTVADTGIPFRVCAVCSAAGEGEPVGATEAG